MILFSSRSLSGRRVLRLLLCGVCRGWGEVVLQRCLNPCYKRSLLASRGWKLNDVNKRPCLPPAWKCGNDNSKMADLNAKGVGSCRSIFRNRPTCDLHSVSSNDLSDVQRSFQSIRLSRDMGRSLLTVILYDRAVPSCGSRKTYTWERCWVQRPLLVLEISGPFN